MPKKQEKTQEAASASEMAENASAAVQADAENVENTAEPLQAKAAYGTGMSRTGAVDTENNENLVAGSEDAIQGAAMESAAEENKTGASEIPTVPNALENQEEIVEKPKLEQGNTMVNLSVLADRHRIPSWQQAALLRYMGWQDDKLVSDEDYMAAMQALKTRRIGGGRR